MSWLHMGTLVSEFTEADMGLRAPVSPEEMSTLYKANEGAGGLRVRKGGIKKGIVERGEEA